MKISIVSEERWILDELKKFGLLEQYEKCKKFLLLGHYQNIDLKIRQPKQDKIYQFRINKQYRGICIIKEDKLRVIKVDNHQ